MSRNNDRNEFDFDAQSMSDASTTTTSNCRLFIRRKRPVAVAGASTAPSVASVAAMRSIPPSQQQSLGVSSTGSTAGGSVGSNGNSNRLRIMRRRRKRDDLQPSSSLSFEEEEEDDEFDDASNDSIGVAVVRGAGTSSLAVQDAGTHRMLHDDCEYLCCTILNANTPQQAIEAAIDLGILLSSRNTRSVLFWKQGGGGGQQRQQQSRYHQQQQTPRNENPNKHDAMTFDDGGKTSTPTRPAALQSVLNVIAKALAQKPKAQRRGRSIAASAITFKSPATISSAPNGDKGNIDTDLATGRTKNARKRLKLKSQAAGGVLSSVGAGDDGGGSVGGSITGGNDNVELGMSIEMRQVIASILYFVSWDCTMSEKNSIAAMGVIKSSRMARNLRMDILHHGEALRAILNLVCISSSSEIGGSKAFSSSSSLARSKSSSKSRSRASTPATANSSSPKRSSKQRRLIIMKNSNYSGSVLEKSGRVSTPTTPRSSNSSTKKPASPAALSSPRLSSADSLSYIGSNVSSVSYQEDDLKLSPVPQHAQPSGGGGESSRFGDPTAAGRRGRRHRRTINEANGVGGYAKEVDPTAAGRRMLSNKRQQQQRRLMMQSIAENDTANHGIDDIDEENLDFGGTIIPSPPVKRAKRLGHYNSNVTTYKKSVGSNFSFASSNDNFTPPTTPPRRKQQRTQIGKELNFPDDGSVASTSTIGSVNSLLSNRVSSKLNKLLSKVCYSINIVDGSNKKLSVGSSSSGGDRDDDTCCSLKNRTSHSHGMTWVSMIALESFDRIVKGKGEDSSSCLEPDDSDNNNNDRGIEGDEDNDDILCELNNPIMTTNKLLSENQVIPILGRVMSRSLQSVSQKMLSQQNPAGYCKCEEDDYCWAHWEYRLSILASLMDEACLFHKRNRITFCESNPFSFVDRDGGLIFRIVVLLRQYSTLIRGGECNGDDNENKIDKQKLSGIMLLALRTLTSLTHDNELAAEQLTVRYPCEGYFPDDDDDNDEGMIRGVDVLAELIYELERDNKENKSNNNHHLDEESLHRFDSTNFCLNTLSNIIDAGDVRRTLAEITVDPQIYSSRKGRTTLWLKWLCIWFVSQTETFQDAIFALGKQGKSSSSNDNKKSSGAARELQKNEEDRLVAAGNGCILLACMMKEPKEIPEEPESTNAIRQLILAQLPRNDDDKGSSSYTLIINTLKAFCNFYYYSVGDLSLAVVAPVKGLIGKLQELEKEEKKELEKEEKNGN